MPLVSFFVNGLARHADVQSDEPLLWALRERLGLTGTQYGCGVGVCGTCTVHVDGKVARACVTSASQIQGSQVITIEGLASGETLHPLQQAWLDEEVAQCGFCQPAQLMAAAALLAANPHPSDADIDEAMREVVCRCGTYPRIRRAIHRAAARGRA